MQVGLRMGTLFLVTLGRLNRPEGDIVEFDAWVETSGEIEVRDLTQEGRRPPAEVLRLQLPDQKEKRKVRFTVVFHNVGPIHVKVKGSIVIMDAATGRILDRVPLVTGTGTVLPYGWRRFGGAWEKQRKLKPGHYLAEARIRFPGAPMVRRTLNLELLD
jgi:hypothetical protein